MIEVFAVIATCTLIKSERLLPRAKAPLPSFVIEEIYGMSSVKYGDKWYYFSEQDIDLMARVVMSEASTQSDLCQEAVATVILNRYFNSRYPNTIAGVIEGQFSTQNNGEPTEEVYLAVHSAMKWFGTYCQVVPSNCFYFRSGHYHEWAEDYCQIDDLYFSVPKEN